MQKLRFTLATRLIIALDRFSEFLSHSGPVASAIAKLGGEQK